MDAEHITNILQAWHEVENRDIRIYREKKIGYSICDLMAVTDSLTGYEIKSDLDNYRRLSSQINAYDEFFNKNYIVVGKKRLRNIYTKIPSHWGIISVSEDNLCIERTAKNNRRASLEQQLSILWEVELKNLLIENDLPLYSLKGRNFIIQQLAKRVEKRTLFKQIAAELKTRDYAAVYGEDCGDDGVEIFGRELIDTLSDAISGNFTLDKWIEIFGRAKGISERKHAAVKKVIERRIPHAVSYRDIEASLGAPWISVEIVNDFIYHILGFDDPEIYRRHRDWLSYDPYIVRYEEITGCWFVREKDSFAANNSNALIEYGIKKYNALYIIEATLNLREINLNFSNGNYDERSTLAALEKQKLIIDEFKTWLWQDEDRIWEVEEAYNAIFEGISQQNFDGSALTFPEMNVDISLYDYQKDAVQKIISSPNTLLAFDVGAGKTYIMIAAAMELRRRRLSQKNMFVVPNNIVGQWEAMFTALYPSAKVLVIEPGSFKKEMREKVLLQAQSGDFDGIIVAYSCFEQIKLSTEYIYRTLGEKTARLNEAIKNLNSGGYSWGRTPLEREIKYIKSLMSDLIKGLDSRAGQITFDKLGINTLFVDEAHNFKNIPIRTNVKNLRGINVVGSKKCLEMLEKVRCVQSQNGGRGVVFATGTPLSNSISDVYTMQLYLQGELLERLRLDRFDNWVKTFARIEQVCEIDVHASGFRFVRRFSRFFNLPELSKLFSLVSIFYATDKNGLPEFTQYTDIVIERSAALADYIKELCERTEKIRAKEVTANIDNMLKVTTDGRKAALDLTLVERRQSYDGSSKVVRCAENVVSIYNEYTGCTQLVFCDYSVPHANSFSVYEELKKRLIKGGIPQGEIAFIHTSTDELSRLKLYEDFNAGRVRVIIGSTFKLGIGANVQKKLKAIHHIDVPWRPADMVQREGRILRRGNENSRVLIYRYIINGSFDAYSWQILEAKQRFISQFLSGSSYTRSTSDLENTVLTYAEVKALALSDERIKALAEKENAVRNLRVLYMQECETKDQLKREKAELEEQIPLLEGDYENTLKNAERIAGADKVEVEREIRQLCENTDWKDIYIPRTEPLGCICGFSVVLPMKQSDKKPYIILSGCGVSYTMEVSASATGNVRRFLNFLGNFNRQVELKRQLVEQCKARLTEIDRLLPMPYVYDKQLAEATKNYETAFAEIRGSSPFTF